MTSGIRSRRLAHAIQADLPDDIEPAREDLRSWLAGMGIAEWRTRYDASASGVLDLLDFTRLRQRSLLKTLLETGCVDIALPVDLFDLPTSQGPYTLEPMRGQPQPAPLAVYAGDELVSTIASQDHTDVSSILATGLDIDVELNDRTDPPRLSIALSPGDETDEV